MADIVKLEKPEQRLPAAQGFLETETARDILRSLALVRSIDGPAMTMISGAPGIGKTETLRYFETQDPNGVLLLTVTKGEGNPLNVAKALAAKFGMSQLKGYDLFALRKEVAACIGPKRILLIDEAQNLYQRHKVLDTGSSFEWLWAASEDGGFDLVFCGDLTLQNIIAGLPHLQSRMRRPITAKAVSRADVVAMAGRSGLTQKPEVNLLAAVAVLPGGLRNVANVVRLADMFAGQESVGALHLKAAVADLNLEPHGGK